jgi:hypothetical protein
VTWIPAAVIRGFFVVASLATLVAAAVHVATYGPREWAPVLMTIWPPLFAGIFVLYGFVIVVMSLSRIPFDLLIADLPLAVKIGGGILMVYVVFNFGLAFRMLQGSADQDPVYVARLFTGHALFFYAASAALGYEVDRARRGLLDLNRGPRDDAVERDPLPWPLSRSVVLQTGLSPADCAARLQQPGPRSPFAFVGGYGIRGEANPDGFRLELGGMRGSMVYAVGRFEGTSPTFIRILLSFKRFYLILIGLTVLLLPIVAWMFGGLGFAWPAVLFLILVGGGGNVVYGIAEMRSLEGQIRRATESQPVSIG